MLDIDTLDLGMVFSTLFPGGYEPIEARRSNKVRCGGEL